MIHDKDHEPPKNPECAACQDDIPFKWDGNQWVHLDLFATKEYGCVYPCPVPREEPDATNS